MQRHTTGLKEVSPLSSYGLPKLLAGRKDVAIVYRSLFEMLP